MDTARKLTRRQFFKVSAVAGGGLLLEFYIGGDAKRGLALAALDTLAPNAWIRIGRDDSVLMHVASSEMGQGVMTAIPMLLADELDADWSKVRAEHAPADKAFHNPLFGRQATGGSTAIRGFWQVVREAGATARELMVDAAARNWEVPADSIRTENGVAIHKPSGRRLRYGELVDKAATLPVPQAVLLKEPKEFRLIGKSIPRLDTPAKVDGSAQFGMDVRLPGMLTAVVARCPVFGGSVKRFDPAGAKRVRGVREVVKIESGLAVIAEDFWSAKRGREALDIEWDEGPHAWLTSGLIRSGFEVALMGGLIVRNEGNAADAIRYARKLHSAMYEVPYLAHACMEPMNCTARVAADGADIWVGTQAQSATQSTAARLTGLPPEKIRVHTLYLGGGFGRRGEQDFVAEAVELARHTGKPVKVVWTREDDTQHDFYRPATLNRLTAVLGKHGLPLAWRHEIAGPSILARVFPDRAGDGKDFSSTEGAANLPYGIPNIEVRYAMVHAPVPVGFWRSVGSSQNAYITECFLDELAAAGRKDPYDLRRKLLARHPRHKRALELAAQKAGWGKKPPAGRHRGIAVAESFKSVCAQVAEVSVERGRSRHPASRGTNPSLDVGRVRVHRVVCAIDCGTVVNPGIIEAQMESGIVYGLTAALKGEITIDKGRVVQGNFDDYPLLTIEEMPAVEVHIVRSSDPPTGVGEPGTPPIAPAVANAVFAATGKPVRSLPIRI